MKNGPYELILAPKKYPGKRYRGRYAYEHHIVFWKKTGKVIGPGEVIHHKNEKRRDNRFENLEMISASDHSVHHNKVEPLNLSCGFCKKDFKLKPSFYRTRINRNSSGLVFCCRSCAVRSQQSNLKISRLKELQRLYGRPVKT